MDHDVGAATALGVALLAGVAAAAGQGGAPPVTADSAATAAELVRQLVGGLVTLLAGVALLELLGSRAVVVARGLLYKNAPAPRLGTVAFLGRVLAAALVAYAGTALYRGGPAMWPTLAAIAVLGAALWAARWLVRRRRSATK